MRARELPLFDVVAPGRGTGVDGLWSRADSDAGVSTAPAAKRKSKRRQDYETMFLEQIRAARLPEPARQFKFARAMDRLFSADFTWLPRYPLIVEIQGGIWRPGGGAHSHPSNIERDIEKQQCVAFLGYRLLPLTEKDIRSKVGIDLTCRLLERLGWERRVQTSALAVPA